MLRAALAVALLLAFPSLAQAFTVSMADSASSGTHTMTFTVTAGAADEQFAISIYGYVQHPQTPLDDPFTTTATTTCFAHGVCRTADPGCVAFGQHLRTGGTGFGGTRCGWWAIPAGQTRRIVTSVFTGYATTPTWGTY